MDSSATPLEVGKLYLERGDVLQAIKVLEPLSIACLKSEDYNTYLDSLHLLFRCYAELLDFDKIRATKLTLDLLVGEQKLQPTSKTYYTLALCASYTNDDAKTQEYCQKALSLALTENDQEAVCYALMGLAISYYYRGQLDDSLKEIYNLQVFMNVLDIPQVRLSAHILKGQILRKMKKYDQALDILWSSYEMLKTQKNLYTYLSLLYGLALTYKESGRPEEARSYLMLAQKSIDKNNLRKLSIDVDNLLESLGDKKKSPYDIVFNSSEHTVHERKKGRIDFNNQFILMDLLKLFLTNPGVSFSKEQLVKMIWKQSYNPAVHDNKIYVTIKRLRQLIEPELDQPRYIFRSKHGYYFNNESKILFEDEKREKV